MEKPRNLRENGKHEIVPKECKNLKLQWKKKETIFEDKLIFLKVDHALHTAVLKPVDATNSSIQSSWTMEKNSYMKKDL